MSSPTQRTLAECKRLGWHVGIVERYVHQIRKKFDLFGCIDLVAVCGDKVMGIQATSGSNHAARVAKALAEPRLRAWLAAGALFEVWSWSRRGERGKRKLWALRREPVELRMLPTAVMAAQDAALLQAYAEEAGTWDANGSPA